MRARAKQNGKLERTEGLQKSQVVETMGSVVFKANAAEDRVDIDLQQAKKKKKRMKDRKTKTPKESD